MNRRGFIGALGAAIVGARLDPERLLWVPGQKLISIPVPRRLVLSKQAFERRPRFKIGDTVWLRRPRQFCALEGLSFQPIEPIERFDPVTLDSESMVEWAVRNI